MDFSIALRIQKYLSGIYPFVYFTDEEREIISKEIKITVVDSGVNIFSADQKTEDFFYLVKKGSVEILDSAESTELLVDRCGEGDTFGIRPLLAHKNYRFAARATEQSILYEIPVEKFIEYYKRHPDAIEFVVGRLALGDTRRDHSIKKENKWQFSNASEYLIRPSFDRDLIHISQDSSIKESIDRMNQHDVSSIIITDEVHRPLGILTDKDIRKLLSREVTLTAKVTDVMNSPVKCISQGLTIRELQMIMMETGYGHLCVTEDGTDQTKAIGMLTDSDLLYANASNPLVIMKKVKKAKTTVELKAARKILDKIVVNYLNDDIDKEIRLNIIDQLNTTLIKKTVLISLDQYNRDHDFQITTDMFSFYSMGSIARGEQLILTDQDNGMLVENGQEENIAHFLKFGHYINKNLESMGYEWCPAEMMACHPNWCKTVDQMKKMVTTWILEPDPENVLKTSIFFDFKHECGNESLSDAMLECIADNVEEDGSYLRFLAQQAYSNPSPISFFRQFIVEKDGKNEDQFDVKGRGLSPLIDLARVIALSKKWVASPATKERFRVMETLDPGNAELYVEAREAFLELLEYRLKFALKYKSSGRYIDIKDLDKKDRINLRKNFEPSKKLFSMIQRKYQLNLLG